MNNIGFIYNGQEFIRGIHVFWTRFKMLFLKKNASETKFDSLLYINIYVTSKFLLIFNFMNWHSSTSNLRRVSHAGRGRSLHLILSPFIGFRDCFVNGDFQLMPHFPCSLTFELRLELLCFTSDPNKAVYLQTLQNIRCQPKNQKNVKINKCDQFIHSIRPKIDVNK